MYRPQFFFQINFVQNGGAAYTRYNLNLYFKWKPLLKFSRNFSCIARTRLQAKKYTEVAIACPMCLLFEFDLRFTMKAESKDIKHCIENAT